MHQNDHISLSAWPGHLFSVSFTRIVRAATCAAVFCLSFGILLPAHAQDTTSGTTDKKSKKKAHTPTPPKTKPAPEAVARVIVLFPPETKGGVSDQIADAISDVVQSRLTLSGKYKPVAFLPSAPTVRRALIEGTLKKEELDHPVATDALIKKLTDLTGHDMAFVVSIIDYQFDKGTNKVSIVMSAKILDYTGPAPRGTNRNGDSPDKPAAKATEYDLATALARDLTEKMVSDLLAPAKPVAADPDKK